MPNNISHKNNFIETMHFKKEKQLQNSSGQLKSFSTTETQ